MSLLVICEISRQFVNTFTPDDKYSLRNGEILEQPIQMHLSKKEITLSEVFAPFLKFTQYLNILKKKVDRHSLYILEITECEGRG